MMRDTTYRVLRGKDDSFVVEIVRPGALPRTVSGFASEAETANWIAQDKRLWDSGRPWVENGAGIRRILHGITRHGEGP
jgi:hypothetical protein